MFTTTDSFVIARPLNEVFDFVANLENLPEWAAGVKTVSRAPLGPTHAGTVFTVTGLIANRPLTVAYAITEYEPNAKLSATGKFGFLRFRETFTFLAEGVGTRVGLVNEMTPDGIARLAEPLWALVIGKQIRADNVRLKQRLEGRR
jgi:carbon monoxide dehydrogenase subunit G